MFSDAAWEGLDHVQGDPFAAPSRLRARVPAGISGFPAKLFSDRTRKMALADWLARRIRSAIRGTGTARVGSGRSGLIAIDAGGQEVLERSAILVTSEWVEARLSVGLPAAGRRVLGQQAAEIFCRTLPEVIDTSLQWEQLPQQEINEGFRDLTQLLTTLDAEPEEKGVRMGGDKPSVKPTRRQRGSTASC